MSDDYKLAEMAAKIFQSLRAEQSRRRDQLVDETPDADPDHIDLTTLLERNEK